MVDDIPPVVQIYLDGLAVEYRDVWIRAYQASLNAPIPEAMQVRGSGLHPDDFVKDRITYPDGGNLAAADRVLDAYIAWKREVDKREQHIEHLRSVGKLREETE